MSDVDHKTATVLDANDLLSLVRLGKLNAEGQLVKQQFMTIAAKSKAIADALNTKYDLDPRYDDLDDETGAVMRNARPRPATVTPLESVK